MWSNNKLSMLDKNLAFFYERNPNSTCSLNSFFSFARIYPPPFRGGWGRPGIKDASPSLWSQLSFQISRSPPRSESLILFRRWKYGNGRNKKYSQGCWFDKFLTGSAGSCKILNNRIRVLFALAWNVKFFHKNKIPRLFLGSIFCLKIKFTEIWKN